MSCMKCGRDVEGEFVFCPECLEEMKKYPVKPGIAIQLPHRRESAQRRTAIRTRTGSSQEEQIRSLKKRLRNRTILWLVTLAMLAALLYPAARYLLQLGKPLLGQNYTTIITDSTDSD